MRFKAKDGAIREEIAPLRANHIVRITSNFKLDLIKPEIILLVSQERKLSCHSHFALLPKGAVSLYEIYGLLTSLARSRATKVRFPAILTEGTNFLLKAPLIDARCACIF